MGRDRGHSQASKNNIRLHFLLILFWKTITFKIIISVSINIYLNFEG